MCGDIVKEGTLLVEGKIQGKYTDPIYVHSSADIEAKVWYSKKEKAYLNQDIEELTGNEEKKYTVKFNNLEINLYKTLSKFENYDTICEEKKLSLFSNFYLPLEIVKKVNYEKQIVNKTYKEEKLKNITIEKLEKELVEELPQKSNIINKQVNYMKGEGYIEVEVIYEVLENIGTKEKIVF